jgi:hypothetical protein
MPGVLLPISTFLLQAAPEKVRWAQPTWLGCLQPRDSARLQDLSSCSAYKVELEGVFISRACFDYGTTDESNKGIGKASTTLRALIGAKQNNYGVVQGEALILEHELNVVMDEHNLAEYRLWDKARGHVLRPNAIRADPR